MTKSNAELIAAILRYKEVSRRSRRRDSNLVENLPRGLKPEERYAAARKVAEEVMADPKVQLYIGLYMAAWERRN